MLGHCKTSLYGLYNYCLKNKKIKNYTYENSKASSSSQNVIRSCCMAQTLLMQKASE
jgi:hypothetical protein